MSSKPLIEQNSTKRHAKSQINRRSALSFLASGGTAGALALSGWPLGENIFADTFDRRVLSANQWKQMVGAAFDLVGTPFESTVQVPNGASIWLVQVSEENWREKDPNRPKYLRPNSLSLLFLSDVELESATYTVRHPKLGQMTLFLNETRFRNQGDARFYVAVFN